MESRELIERLLSLSEAIEHAAQLADWPEAARRTEERSPLLNNEAPQYRRSR